MFTNHTMYYVNNVKYLYYYTDAGNNSSKILLMVLVKKEMCTTVCYINHYNENCRKIIAFDYVCSI